MNYPASQDEAMELVAASGVEPTIIVHSGHGLQVWWLFSEFYSFDSDIDRTEIALLAERWNRTLRVRAAEHNWKVDSTYDLARVFRVPGTWNYKTDDPVQVQLLSLKNELRYSTSDFEEHLVDEKLIGTLGLNLNRTYIVGELDLNKDVEPNSDKIEALRLAEPRFAESLDRTRKQGNGPAWTGSEYDMSLATFAAQAGWSDQEIAEMIISTRRKHNDKPEKALRRDYMKKTISKARQRVGVIESTEIMEEATDQLVEAKASGDDETVRAARRVTMDALSQQFGIEVVGFLRYVSDPPAYAMLTPLHTVQLGGPHDLLNYTNFKACVFGATNHYVDCGEKKQWDSICTAIGKCAEDQDIGAEATDSGAMENWLVEYLENQPPVTSVDEAISEGFPFYDDEGVYVHGQSFLKWVKNSQGERNTTPRQIGRMMHTFGGKQVNKNVSLKEAGKMRRTTRNFWQLPSHFVTKVAIANSAEFN